jgi:probable F420-dependent oxidoreductase
VHFAFNMPLARFASPSGSGNRDLVQTLARALEVAGFSAALMSEHPAPSARWLREDPAAHDSLDPLTALAFVAGCTRDLKVFTNIVVLPYRNPFLTAKAAASLQILSDNRLLLGVGAGYMKEEFAALGVAHRERGTLTDEALETIRKVWAGGPVAQHGLHFEADDIEARPVPASPPPIWIGGGSDRAVERAARWGDGWVPYFSVPTADPIVRRSAVTSMEHFGEKVGRLRELREMGEKHRPFDLVVSPPSRPADATRSNAQQFLEEVDALKSLGATWIWTSLPAANVETYLERVQWFGEEIIGGYRRSTEHQP